MRLLEYHGSPLRGTLDVQRRLDLVLQCLDSCPQRLVILCVADGIELLLQDSEQRAVIVSVSSHLGGIIHSRDFDELPHRNVLAPCIDNISLIDTPIEGGHIEVFIVDVAYAGYENEILWRPFISIR